MRIRLYPEFFLKELFLFAGALAAGIFIAYRYSVTGLAPDPAEQIQFTWGNIIALAFFFTLFTVVLMRYRKLADSSLRIFLMLVIFSGAELFFGTFIAFPYDTVLGLVFLGVVLMVRSVLSHNIGIGLGIAGIAALLGLSISPLNAIIVLVFLSIYDIVAVYKTRHMITLARSMVKSGAIFGFIIPFHWRDFFEHRDHAEPGERFMILGSGDIGLPIVLVASIVSQSLASAALVGTSSVLGLLVTHLIFVNQTGRQPMAALPPIATMSIIGYLVSLLLI